MSISFVKYCPLCDTENPSTTSFCNRCDGDLMNAPVVSRRENAGFNALDESTSAQVSAAPDTTDAATACEPALRLELVENPTISFTVRAGQTVGRADKADVVLHGVPHLDFVSRLHARFIHRRGQWYVQYVAQGNFIKVDGTEYNDDSEVALFADSMVVLSLTAFRVRLISP